VYLIFVAGAAVAQFLNERGCAHVRPA